jgi:LysR family transcriptional regulator for bpeEF and oprC
MELSALNIFVKVVQAGSFTRAAELLGTQKAHVSRVVAQLERGLGARLLERSTRALSLTEVGREFFERAVGILAAVDDAQRAVAQAQGTPRGRLRLTCGVEFGLIAVSGWIRGYLERHPQVEVDADFTARIVDLVHDGFDLAIRLGDLPDSSLAARRLGTLAYGLFGAPTYLARRGTPAHPRDLAAHDLVVFTGGATRGGWSLAAGSERAEVPLRGRLRVNNSLAVRDAAVGGLGVARLPWLLAAPEVAQGRLVPVLRDWASPAVPVHAVFASARYLTPKVRAFVDHAAEAFACEVAAAPSL